MLPKKIGKGKERRLYGDEAGGPPLRKLRDGGTLAELKQDYELFTYAPLCLYGGLDFNPVQEWINTYGHGQVVFVLTLDMPVIYVGGHSKWDKTLWAVVKEHWPSLSLHIGGIAILDRSRRRLVRPICQEIPIIDPPGLDKFSLCGALPETTVYTFSVDSNIGCLVFTPATNLLTDKPKLLAMPPNNDTIKLADGLLRNLSDPYKDVPPLTWKNNEDQDPSAAKNGS